MLSGCGGEEAERKRLELQRAVDSLQFEPRPGQAAAAGDQRRRRRSSRTTATSYETLLATADSRMYRDKTRRKRTPAHEAGAPAGDRRRTPRDVDAAAVRGRHSVATIEVRSREVRRAHRTSARSAAPALDSSSSIQSGLASRQARPEERHSRGADDQAQAVEPPGAESAAELEPGGRRRQREPDRTASGAAPDEPQQRARERAAAASCDSIIRRGPHAAASARCSPPRRAPASSGIDLNGAAVRLRRRDRRCSSRRHGHDRRRPYSIAASPEDARRDGCLELLVGVDADGTPGRT